MLSHLGNLRLYKFDVPSYSDVGVILVTEEHIQSGCRFQLTQFTGEKQDSKAAGLSQDFVDLLSDSFFYANKDSHITNQIFTYLISNFSFKNLEIVPLACPVLVFHFDIRELHHTVPAPEIDILEAVMDKLGVKPYILDIADVHEDRFVSIAPTATEIRDCYQGQDLCCLCGKGCVQNSLQSYFSCYLYLKSLVVYFSMSCLLDGVATSGHSNSTLLDLMF